MRFRTHIPTQRNAFCPKITCPSRDYVSRNGAQTFNGKSERREVPRVRLPPESTSSRGLGSRCVLLPVLPAAPPPPAPSGLHPLSRTSLLRPAHGPLRALVSFRSVVGTCCRSCGGGAAAASTCRWVARVPAAPPPAPPAWASSLSGCPQGRHLAFPFISLLPCQASSGIVSQAYVMSSRRTCPGYVLSSRRTSQGYVR